MLICSILFNPLIEIYNYEHGLLGSSLSNTFLSTCENLRQASAEDKVLYNMRAYQTTIINAT